MGATDSGRSEADRGQPAAPPAVAAAWQLAALAPVSEEHFQIATSLLPLGFWKAELATRQWFRSESLDSLLGFLPQEAHSLSDFVGRLHPDDAPRFWKAVAAASSGDQLALEHRIVLPNGEIRYLVSQGQLRRDAQGTVQQVHGVTRDVTEHVLLARRIQESEESHAAICQQLQTLRESLQQRIAERTRTAEHRAAQLRRLASELTQAEQRERRRLAQMLHDHLQQLLYAARLRLGWVRRHIGDSSVQDALHEVDTLLDQSIGESRSLTTELSPPVLYDGGLAASLDWLGRMMFEKHGLLVTVHLDAGAEPAEEDTRVVLFQVVRELLFNVVKHAHTEQASVEMAVLNGQQLQILVQDAGVGFDQTRLESPGAETRGFGLFSIRERLEVMGGELRLRTAPGQGTRIQVVAPRNTRPSKPPLAPVKTAGTARVARRRSVAQAPSPASGATPRRIRVLVADDHAILREGLITLLAEDPQIEVVGEASDGQRAVELALALRPDVVLMDVTMPQLNGIEATRRITAELPEVRVIGLSMHQQQDMATAMLEAGAVAYLRKGDSSENVMAAIRGTLVSLDEPKDASG